MSRKPRSSAAAASKAKQATALLDRFVLVLILALN
jgi:hypothetical protein